MSTPSIGSYSFTTWRGILAFGGNNVRLYEQGGIAGFGVVIGGLKTRGQNVLTSTRYSSESSAISDGAGQRGLMASSVTVVDQFGVTWSNVIVLNAVVGLANDPLGWILNTSWVLLPLSQ